MSTPAQILKDTFGYDTIRPQNALLFILRNILLVSFRIIPNTKNCPN
jgi:hypothetical protein